ncbi:MAG: D-glycero-alpha-D-manno-heptose-1,7-bisphosphate 7-phosphatase [Pseudobdellovibrionaceae bacterium]
MQRLKKPTVFLDRDGTIIEDKIYLNDPDNIVYLPHAFESLSQLYHSGFQLVIVTNQSGIAKGIVDVRNLDEIHRRIRSEFHKHGVAIAGFYYAPYGVDSHHPVRKPGIGMLEYADRDFGVDFSRSWMVGDRMSDIEAGHRAGCKSILIKALEKPEDFRDWAPPEFVIESLRELPGLIVGGYRN